MSAEAAITKWWAVGKRYRCTLSVPRPRPGAVQHAVCTWEPAMPTRLTRAELADYVAGRDRAVNEIVAEHGVSMAMVDLR